MIIFHKFLSEAHKTNFRSVDPEQLTLLSYLRRGFSSWISSGGKNRSIGLEPNVLYNFDEMAKTKLAQPWWLEVGTDVCPACNHPYAYQTEFYCVDCDGPVCALCVIETVEVGHLCPGCVPSGDSNLEARD